jgi:hypothetical protein
MGAFMGSAGNRPKYSEATASQRKCPIESKYEQSGEPLTGGDLRFDTPLPA